MRRFLQFSHPLRDLVWPFLSRGSNFASSFPSGSCTLCDVSVDSWWFVGVQWLDFKAFEEALGSVSLFHSSALCINTFELTASTGVIDVKGSCLLGILRRRTSSVSINQPEDPSIFTVEQSYTQLESLKAAKRIAKWRVCFSVLSLLTRWDLFSRAG